MGNKVPASLLLLSRAMYLPEQVGTSEALQKTLSDLPEAIVRGEFNGDSGIVYDVNRLMKLVSRWPTWKEKLLITSVVSRL